jgi:hypothetical protein
MLTQQAGIYLHSVAGKQARKYNCSTLYVLQRSCCSEHVQQPLAQRGFAQRGADYTPLKVIKHTEATFSES